MKPSLPPTTPDPTPANSTIKMARARTIAAIFISHGEKYIGDIELPNNVVNAVSRDLFKLKVNRNELSQLDEKPYAFLSHDQASQSHWFMRRFRNSGGWRDF
jgi:hypothetical protein